MKKLQLIYYKSNTSKVVTSYTNSLSNIKSNKVDKIFKVELRLTDVKTWYC